MTSVQHRCWPREERSLPRPILWREKIYSTKQEERCCGQVVHCFDAKLLIDRFQATDPGFGSLLLFLSLLPLFTCQRLLDFGLTTTVVAVMGLVVNDNNLRAAISESPTHPIDYLGRCLLKRVGVLPPCQYLPVEATHRHSVTLQESVVVRQFNRRLL
jgi:hypothetical protein